MRSINYGVYLERGQTMIIRILEAGLRGYYYEL